MISSITFDDISPTCLSASKFQSILEILDEMDIRCTFFVVPGEYSYPSPEADFRSCLKKALRSGHELSLHGYKHAKNEFGYLCLGSWSIPFPMLPLPSLSNQKEKIEQATEAFLQITEVRPLGFRAPWYLFNNQTLIALSNLGFRYDSSETIFKPVHNSLKIRWFSQIKPHWVHGVLEIPVTVDSTYNLSNLNFHNSLKRAIRDFEFIASQDGVFVVNIHPNQTELDLLTRFLHDLINKIDGKTSFHRLADLT